jgi:xylan 1,4-beta-xylosidase
MRSRIFTILLLFTFITTYGQPYNFEVNTTIVKGKNTGFWKASGTDLLYYLAEKPSGQALLDRMKETNSCVYLRNHYTLTGNIREGVQVGIEVYSEDENGNPHYDFSRVNRIYGEFVKRGLKPVVECDYLPRGLHKSGQQNSVGNDEGMSVKNAGPEDWDKWYDLLKAFTRNLVTTFGADEVRTWYFEVWNEPDGWKQADMDTFYKMYDVFVDAVTSVDPELKVGGPACYHEWFLRNFLEHVVNGTNHVTGQKGTRIDFISYHLYGLSGGWLNSEPVIQPQVQRFTQTLLWISRLMENYKSLKGVEFHLNEWGMSSNFERSVAEHPDLVYRNNEESPLFLVKMVDCLYAIEDNYHFPTSMLLYWGGSWETEKNEFFIGYRDLLTAGNIPKPIQTGFEMLAQLGDDRLEVKGPRIGLRTGVIATKSSDRSVEMIAYNYNETDDDLSVSDKMNIKISGMPEGSYSVEEYSLDRTHNNTYRTWKKMGSPKTPGDADMKKLKAAGELSVTSSLKKKNEGEGIVLNLKLPRHSMMLIKIISE